MLNIKITISEKEDSVDLLINTPNFNLHFEYNDKEEAALGALKFLGDMGVLKEFQESGNEVEVIASEEVKPAPKPGRKAPASKEEPLPPGYIALPEVCVRTGLKPSTVYNFITDKIFPPADRKWMRKNYWLIETIEKYQEDKKKRAQSESLSRASRPAKKKPEPEEVEEEIDELLELEEQVDIEDIIKSVAG